MEQHQKVEQKLGTRLEAVKKLLGLPDFKQIELLEIALTHPSYIYERVGLTQIQKDQQENKYRRLAHLGDAILGAIVTDYLHRRCSELTKGELTKLKQRLVDKRRLSKFAQELQLKQFCLLGVSQHGKAETGQDGLFSELFEALFGAIYLGFERDFSKAHSWLINHFIADAADELLNNELDDDDDEFDEDDIPSTTVTTRDYLDMIGLHDFSDYGWAPGDDDD